MAEGHPDDRQLLDWLMRRSAPSEADLVARHCSQCPRCREHVEELCALAEGFNQLRDAERESALPPELWCGVSERARPLLDRLRHKHNETAREHRVSSRRLLLQQSWAVAASVLALVGVVGGGLVLWSNLTGSATAAIVEAVGPVTIARPGQPPRQCGQKKELVRPGDVISAPEADAAIRLEDATSLALRRGCRLEAHRPDRQQRPTFALRAGTVCVDTTRAKRGVCIKTPSGMVKCRKGKTVVQLASSRCCKATALQGEAEVETDGHVTVISPGVCAELKRTEPCCCRPARPKETCCDWVDRCGNPKEPKERTKE